MYELVCAIFLGSTCSALILLLQHDRLSAQGTLPGIVSEERIYLFLKKTSARQAPHACSAFLAVHILFPSIWLISIGGRQIEILRILLETTQLKSIACFAGFCLQFFGRPLPPSRSQSTPPCGSGSQIDRGRIPKAPVSSSAIERPIMSRPPPKSHVIDR